MEKVSKQKDFLGIVGGGSGRKLDMEQKYLSWGTNGNTDITDSQTHT